MCIQMYTHTYVERGDMQTTVLKESCIRKTNFGETDQGHFILFSGEGDADLPGIQ